ncbi:MAG: regulator of chromosome condensation [Myxococcaceae bacterium]|nr:regulator of chromosome condensation [Myxococcaceae bacterium]
MSRRSAALAALAAALASSCDVSPRLYLTVRTEAGSRVDHVRVEVYSPSGSEAGLSDGSIRPSISPRRPFEMRILGRAGGERVRVNVDGFEGDATLVHQEWVASMPSDGAGYLQIVLWNSCVGVTCPAGTTCSSSGSCVSNAVGVVPPSDTDAGLGFCPDAGAKGCVAIDVPVAADAGRDAGFDAGTDLGPDVGRDVGTDAGFDAGADATRDAAVDVGADAPAEVGVDAARCPGPSAVSVAGWTRCASGTWCPNLCGPGGSCVQAERIAIGRYHGCALRSDRGVSCWGAGTDGRLGDGSTDGGTPPAPVGVVRAVTGFPLASVAALAAGYDGSCAVDPTGALYCWGSINSDPVLQEFTPAYAATLARRLQRADAGAAANLFDGVAIHETRTCAIVRGGGVRCSSWVRNLPDGTSETVDTPADLPVTDLVRADGAPLDGVVEVGVGLYHACARRRDGTVWCWGTNQYGQLAAPLPLGDGGGLGASEAARQIAGVTGAVSLGVGDFFACALAAGDVRCWGNASLGRVGGFSRAVACANSNDCAPTPVSVEGLAELVDAYRSPAVQIAAGAEETCVRLANGHVWCWGYNHVGQLGLPTTGAGAVEVRAGVSGPPVFTGADDIVTGGSGGGSEEAWTCAHRAADCTWWCWGMIPGEATRPADLGTPRLLRWGP